MNPSCERLLAVQQVSLQRDSFALCSIDFALGAGEVLAILGETGSGKTLLLETIAGFQRPAEGQILFKGRDLHRIPLHRRNIGYLYQEYCMFPHMTVGENIAYGLKMRGVDKKSCLHEVQAIAKRFGIGHLLEQYPLTLSGGEQQRTALARALITHPPLLLLDEPFSALDPVTKQGLYTLLDEIRQRYGCAILFVTHDFYEARRLADRIGILLEGKLQAIVPAAELFTHGWNETVQEFLGLTPASLL